MHSFLLLACIRHGDSLSVTPQYCSEGVEKKKKVLIEFTVSVFQVLKAKVLQCDSKKAKMLLSFRGAMEGAAEEASAPDFDCKVGQVRCLPWCFFFCFSPCFFAV